MFFTLLPYLLIVSFINKFWLISHWIGIKCHNWKKNDNEIEEKNFSYCSFIQLGNKKEKSFTEGKPRQVVRKVEVHDPIRQRKLNDSSFIYVK